MGICGLIILLYDPPKPIRPLPKRRLLMYHIPRKSSVRLLIYSGMCNGGDCVLVATKSNKHVISDFSGRKGGDDD